MPLLIFISIYIINIFLARWLNKIAYKHFELNIAPPFWFIPIVSIFALIIIIIGECIEKYIKIDINMGIIDWFKGKNW